MKREINIDFINQNSDYEWDITIIGGGATGLGIAVDSASRGFKTLLLEQHDFTKGTSSRSTKLVHGGVRYLAQGNVKLVLEALEERGLLLKNAPHLTRNQSFIIPAYTNWKALFYLTGLKLYDLLSGKLSLGKSELITKKTIEQFLPTIKKDGLKKGILYHDGQFDDSRLGICLAQTASDLGAKVINYIKVTSLHKDAEGFVNGVSCTDQETNISYNIKSKCVVNATGVFADDVLKLDKKDAPDTVQPSQGVHIVLDKSFLNSDHGLMIPETPDGRVLFAIPWHGKVVVGTTDTLVKDTHAEPIATGDEIDFILNTFSDYSDKKPTRKDILSVFTGLRPLARKGPDSTKTKEMSRNHKLIVSDSRLITITGGKWTTYRKMAEDTVNSAIKITGLRNADCSTKHLHLHGYELKNYDSYLDSYGSDKLKIESIIKSDPELGEQIHPRYPYLKAEIVWSVQNEMARTPEDFLARRIRLLFIDARAAIESSEIVSKIMANQLNKNDSWIEIKNREFIELAEKYLYP